MNRLDILLIVVFVAAVVTGFRRGLIGQIGAVAAVVIGLIGCRLFGDSVSGMFCSFVPASMQGTVMQQFIPTALANALIYTVVYYLVKFLAGSLRMVAKLMLMGPLDRALGIVFSLFKWGLGLSVGLNAWMALFPTSNAVRNSTLGGGVAVETVMELAPWAWGITKAQFEALNHEPRETADASEAL